MKVIDTHTHLAGALIGAAPRPVTDLRRELEDDGVTGAWVMTTDGLIRDTNRHNDVLAEAVRPHRDFFAPFCTVDPYAGAEAACAELERAHAQLGMRGLKLHPWLQAFSLSNPAVVPILRKAGRLGMPVLVHDGTPPYATPLQIAAAAEQAAETVVILGHAGLDDLYEDAILACLRHGNVYVCCCAPSSGYIAEIVRRCPTERVLFGSDAGFEQGLVPASLDKIYDACEDEGKLRRILYENAQSLVAAGT